jgi:hypothetical protein
MKRFLLVGTVNIQYPDKDIVILGWRNLSNIAIVNAIWFKEELLNSILKVPWTVISDPKWIKDYTRWEMRENTLLSDGIVTRPSPAFIVSSCSSIASSPYASIT